MRCVVVVEDEPSIRHLLGELLRLEGFTVVEVASPGALPRAIRDVTPDVFLVDIMLPGVDGVTLAHNLRDEGFSTTPMIAMSASPSMCHDARRSGLFAHTIEKPFNLTTVLESVQRYAA